MRGLTLFGFVAMLGHKSNDQMLFDHYRSLARKSDAEKYFSVAPADEEHTIVEFRPLNR